MTAGDELANINENEFIVSLLLLPNYVIVNNIIIIDNMIISWIEDVVVDKPMTCVKLWFL